MIHISYNDIKRVIKQEDLFEPVKQAFIDYASPRLIGIPVNLLHFENDADAHIKTAAIKFESRAGSAKKINTPSIPKI